MNRRPWAGVLRWAWLPAAACLVAVAGGAVTARAASASASVTPWAWSGYVATGGPYSWVSADFTVPTGTCSQGPAENGPLSGGPGTAYWVGLQGDNGGSVAIVQTGFFVDCWNGQPDYFAWTVEGQDLQYGAETRLSEPVQPGDQIDAYVSCWGGDGYCVEGLIDVTQNWTYTLSVPVVDGFSGYYAAVAAESFNGGIASSPVGVTNAIVGALNFGPIGNFSPGAYEEQPSIYNGTAGLDPTPLDPTGSDFEFYWNGNPGS
jgi:Peptidase A4 family